MTTHAKSWADREQNWELEREIYDLIEATNIVGNLYASVDEKSYRINMYLYDRINALIRLRK